MLVNIKWLVVSFLLCSPSIADDNVLLFIWSGRNLVLKKLKVRSWVRSGVRSGVHSPQPTHLALHQEIRWRIKVCDDGLSGRLRRIAGDPVGRDPPARGHHTEYIYRAVPFPQWKQPEFDNKPPLRAPQLVLLEGDLLKAFPQVDTSARQLGLWIRGVPLLFEQPMVMEPHLPVCQLHRWQLDPTKWSSPTTKSIIPIVVTALRLASQEKALNPPQVDLQAIVRSQRRGQRRRIGSNCRLNILLHLQALIYTLKTVWLYNFQQASKGDMF